ncbi:hypothetical protein JX266_002491 [Neoarthrinium moseri]|nr:hypothetical protein JX266_002491 [Neoarthrinium moseri]
MGGLIPLLLPSSGGSRSSVIVQPTETKRPASVMAAHSPTTPSHRRQQSLPLAKSITRLSLTPIPLPVLPYTPTEWKKTISEVKRKYVNRKYRTCSARCCEVLDNLRETSNVETIYLVYLHFYAASSFEMCARPLSQSSSYRTKLLRDARDHYDRAAAFIQRAEDATVQKTRSGSASSTSSSLHSPSLSISSRSSVCTALSSPRNSVSSVEDMKVKALPKRPKKKKVSFSGLPEPIEIPKNSWQSEPYIRPDSPTLGWEEDQYLFGQREYASETVLPQSCLVQPTSKSADKTFPVRSISTEAQLPSPPILKPVPEEEGQDESFNLESFLQTRSANRLVSQLAALRSQVAWHRDAVDTLLTQPDDIPEIPETPVVPEMPSIPPPPPGMTSTLGGAQAQRLNDSLGRVSNFDVSPAATDLTQSHESWVRTRSDSVASIASSLSYRPSSAASSTRSGGADEALQKRIERLRANGWQRKRFDNRRYEVLREQALSEIGA